MVERDEGSRNGKRIDASDRKQQSPPTFVNHFAKYIESKVSYAEALGLGHANPETHCRGDSGTITAVPSDLSRSYSTPSFDSSVPSTPSLPHSISYLDLESRDSQTENNSSTRRDSPNSSFSATTKPPSRPSASINPLYFGKLKSSLSLPKSFPFLYSSATPNSPSNSNILREELQRLIKRASGGLQRQCANCGNSQHCCGQTILEALSSNPRTS